MTRRKRYKSTGDKHRHTENNQRFLKGKGGSGACSVTERRTIKTVTARRRRSDDEDHIEEQLGDLESSMEDENEVPTTARQDRDQAERG